MTNSVPLRSPRAGHPYAAPVEHVLPLGTYFSWDRAAIARRGRLGVWVVTALQLRQDLKSRTASSLDTGIEI
jgi:hypothetical protein